MSAPLTVAILAGGLTHEREVSLHSGRRVAAALREAGMYVKIFDVDANLLQRLHSMAPDIVWPLIHGSTGEDGSLQDLLELAGHPYVGTDPASCKLASDKAIAAAVLAREGVAMPDSVTIPQKLFREVGVAPILDLIKARFGFPLVVKPSQGGSALGVTIVEESAALPGAMVDCYAYGEDARIEKYIDGREVAVAVMELSPRPPYLRHLPRLQRSLNPCHLPDHPRPLCRLHPQQRLQRRLHPRHQIQLRHMNKLRSAGRQPLGPANPMRFRPWRSSPMAHTISMRVTMPVAPSTSSPPA